MSLWIILLLPEGLRERGQWEGSWFPGPVTAIVLVPPEALLLSTWCHCSATREQDPSTQMSRCPSLASQDCFTPFLMYHMPRTWAHPWWQRADWWLPGARQEGAVGADGLRASLGDGNTLEPESGAACTHCARTNASELQSTLKWQKQGTCTLHDFFCRCSGME